MLTLVSLAFAIAFVFVECYKMLCPKSALQEYLNWLKSEKYWKIPDWCNQLCIKTYRIESDEEFTLIAVDHNAKGFELRRYNTITGELISIEQRVYPVSIRPEEVYKDGDLVR